MFTTIILAMIINSARIVYSAHSIDFFTFGDKNRFTELTNKIINQQCRSNTSTTSNNPYVFYYIVSFGHEGYCGGDELYVPRNLVVRPNDYMYVSDEFNDCTKVFAIDISAYAAALIATIRWQSASGKYVPAGPIVWGIDKDYSINFTYYDDYADNPDQTRGFCILQGLTYWRDGSHAYIYVCDNGNNRIKIYEVGQSIGSLTLIDIAGQFVCNGKADHLKCPRDVRTDHNGDSYAADTYNRRFLKFCNLADSASGNVRYHSAFAPDAEAMRIYGKLGLHQVEMQIPSAVLIEDEAFMLPNDAVPLELFTGEFCTENIWMWCMFYQNTPAILVSDTGDNNVYINSLISHRITVFGYDELLP